MAPGFANFLVIIVVVFINIFITIVLITIIYDYNHYNRVCHHHHNHGFREDLEKPLLGDKNHVDLGGVLVDFFQKKLSFLP